jgi:phenylacetate-CoA ligase
MIIEDMLYPLLGFYLLSPNWLKNSVGRAYSLVPVSFSRGRHYQQFLNESALRDEGKIRALSSKKLAESLQCALTNVPAYRPYRHLLNHLDAPFEVLRQLPLVSKDDIKRDLSSYVAGNAFSSLGLKTATGGSTSTPMTFYLHKGITRTKEYAYMEQFHQRVGLGPRDVILAIRGRTVPAAKRAGGQLWMYEPIKRQLILSSDHLERAHMVEYMKVLRQWRPTYIQAYPSAIYPLARWLRDHPAPDITQRIKGIMLYSENVLDHHMALLKEVFPCPVLKHYGLSERVLMAASMPDDERFFFWPQYGHVELVDEAGNPITQPGILGELVGTGFDNHVMPFIRYRTGDMAILSDKPHPLLQDFPVMERIEGRRQEFIVCRDNRIIAVCGMGAAHSSELAVVDSMQFEQWVPGHFLIKVVAPKPLSAEAKHKIAQCMESKTQGGCTAEVIEVSSIPRTLRGKHCLLVQHLDISRYLAAPELV